MEKVEEKEEPGDNYLSEDQRGVSAVEEPNYFQDLSYSVYL